MKTPIGEALREAIREQRGNETFERALGRIVRRHHGTFSDYVSLIGLVRKRADRDKSSLVEAAKALASEPEAISGARRG